MRRNEKRVGGVLARAALICGLILLVAAMLCVTAAGAEPAADGCEDGHTWGSDTLRWTWAEDNSSVTATFTCSVCGETHDEVASLENGKLLATEHLPTCADSGYAIYDATIYFEEFTNPYTQGHEVWNRKQISLSALGHEWAEPEWKWVEKDGVMHATATFRCVRGCTDVIEVSENTDAAYSGTVVKTYHEPTCGARGYTEYRSTVHKLGLDDVHDVYIVQDTIDNALGHTWKTETWTWSEAEDGFTAKVHFTCTTCGDTHELDAEVEAGEVVAPGCEVGGHTVYVGTLETGKPEQRKTAQDMFVDASLTDTHEGDETEATGHLWVLDRWEFTPAAGGGYTATAVFTCEHGCGEAHSLPAAQVTAEERAATCTEPAGTAYVASLTLVDEGFDRYAANVGAAEPAVLTGEKLDGTGDALGHLWGAKADFAWSEDSTAAKATFTCERCGEKHETDAAVETQVRTQANCTTEGETVYTAKATAPAQGAGAAVTSEETKTVKTPARGHSWGAPSWSWSEDRTGASATFACETCGTTSEQQAEVSGAEEGRRTVHTARVTFAGHTYTAEETTEAHGLPAGAVVGIVLGAVVLAGGVAAAAVILLRKRKKPQTNTDDKTHA